MTRVRTRKYSVVSRVVSAVCLLVSICLFAACGSGQVAGGNQGSCDESVNSAKPACILENDKDADIFVHKNVAYQRADPKEVDHDGMQSVDTIGKVSRRSTSEFSEMSATKLEKGTLIFSTKRSDILLAEVDGVKVPYMAIHEG